MFTSLHYVAVCISRVFNLSWLSFSLHKHFWKWIESFWFNSKSIEWRKTKSPIAMEVMLCHRSIKTWWTLQWNVQHSLFDAPMENDSVYRCLFFFRRIHFLVFFLLSIQYNIICFWTMFKTNKYSEFNLKMFDDVIFCNFFFSLQSVYSFTMGKTLRAQDNRHRSNIMTK